MATQRKGISSVRTLSGRVNQTFTPYRAYMQITCLEMEKSRRLEEQKSAEARIAGIRARLREIEEEEQLLQQTLQQMDFAAGGVEAAGKGHPEMPARRRETQPADRPKKAGFRLKY